MLREQVLKNRSYRRFYEDTPIALETLRTLVDLARNAPSARNVQPLKYILCSDRAIGARVFTTLAWAGYLADWGGPGEGERPAAYIVVLGDKALGTSVGVDEGIALQTILLGAVEQGLGGCIIGSVQRDALRQILNVPNGFEILHVLALGRPHETVVLEEMGSEGDVRYWRDAAQVHHVPKRRLEDVIVAQI